MASDRETPSPADGYKRFTEDINVNISYGSNDNSESNIENIRTLIYVNLHTLLHVCTRNSTLFPCLQRTVIVLLHNVDSCQNQVFNAIFIFLLFVQCILYCFSHALYNIMYVRFIQ